MPKSHALCHPRKFNPEINPELCQFLLATGNSILIEDTRSRGSSILLSFVRLIIQTVILKNPTFELPAMESRKYIQGTQLIFYFTTSMKHQKLIHTKYHPPYHIKH